MKFARIITAFLLPFIVQVASAQVPKFAIPAASPALTATARPQAYFDVIGQQSAVFGHENGRFEAWIFPFQIFREFRLQYQLEDMPYPDDLDYFVRAIEVLPERTTLIYSHPLFTIREHLFAPVSEPAIIILLELETYQDLELFTAFLPSLQPMWPAGMGGQYATWDDQNQAYVISESRRKDNAMLGAPNAKRQSPPLAHELSIKPNLFSFTVTPEAARTHFFPIVITADFHNRESCIERYHKLQTEADQLLLQTHAYYQNFLHNTLRITGTEFDEALQWNKLALHKGFICNPDLGCGMVAGFGPSGASRRPGFGWYFGGDMAINSYAMVGYGDFSVVRRSFEFLQKYQRADGKMMHELSQAGGRLDWFKDYPYGYIHGDTTPFYLAAVDNYFRASGDSSFVRRSWPSIETAYTWSRSTDSNADGLMENTLAGLGASELGSLREATGVDIFLAAIGVQAWKSCAELAGVAGKKKIAAEAMRWYELGKNSLEKLFWNADSQRYNFSLTRNGTPNPELTVWTAFPMIFDLLPDDHARLALAEVASAKISTDWGSRMLATTSTAYEPLAYNNGAVWPFLTGFTTWALFRQRNAEAGLQNLRNLANWLWTDALGKMPEVTSGEYFTPLETSVPDQLFSNFGFTAGLIRGLLGLDIDARTRTIHFTPQLPAAWDSLRIENIIIANDTLSLMIRQDARSVMLEVTNAPKRPIQIDFQPAFGPFAYLDESTARRLPITPIQSASDTRFRYIFRTDTTQAITFDVVDPLRVWLPYRQPQPGDPPQQMRLCNLTRSDRNTLVAVLESPGGTEQTLSYRARGKIAVENGRILNDHHLAVRFDGTGYVRQNVTIRLQQQP